MDLRQGDCLELMKDIPDKSIDMILCDLPYGTTQNKWDIIIPFDKLWEQYRRIIKDNGAVVLTSSQPFTSALVMSNPKMFKYEWIWDKGRGSGHLNSKIMPLKKHDSILVFCKKKTIYNPQFTKGEAYTRTNKASTCRGNYGKHKDSTIKNIGIRFPTTIQHFPIGRQQNKIHPTQKPVNLMEYLIKTYTNEGGLVLDNCMGSGTTGVACKNLDRRFIGMELDKKYFEIAKNRIENTTSFHGKVKA